MVDVALGLTDRLIAERRGLSLRSVQNRLQQVYDKLGIYGEDMPTEAINFRTRAVSLALLRRLINRSGLEEAEADLGRWLKGRSRR